MPYFPGSSHEGVHISHETWLRICSFPLPDQDFSALVLQSNQYTSRGVTRSGSCALQEFNRSQSIDPKVQLLPCSARLPMTGGISAAATRCRMNSSSNDCAVHGAGHKGLSRKLMSTNRPAQSIHPNYKLTSWTHIKALYMSRYLTLVAMDN